MTSSTNVNKNNGKLYIQASHSGNNTRDVLKIKKVFPNLQAEKIKNIQKFIKGNGKSKPKLIMTTKGLSRKQVIVSINNDNKTSFMEDSSNHVTSLNRALRVLTTSKPMRLKFHGYPNPNLTSKSQVSYTQEKTLILPLLQTQFKILLRKTISSTTLYQH